jgi:hypothetical protein
MDKELYINDITDEDLQKLGTVERIFSNIAKEWNLSDKHISKMLSSDLSDKERLIVISATLGIYKSLQIIFGTQENVNSWIHKPNIQFGGESALDYICERGTDGLLTVNTYLQAQRSS